MSIARGFHQFRLNYIEASYKLSVRRRQYYPVIWLSRNGCIWWQLHSSNKYPRIEQDHSGSGSETYKGAIYGVLGAQNIYILRLLSLLLPVRQERLQ